MCCSAPRACRLASLTGLLLGVASATGCGTSKWAMEDPAYAAKYSKPYDGDKLERMAKQAFDARFQHGKGGAFVEAAVAGDPLTVGGELGAFRLPQPISESRVGVIGLLGTGEPAAYVGLDGSLRLHTPTRVAPFVGLGGILAYSETDEPRINDGEDNNDNGLIDERGETDEVIDFMAAVYPETGVHFWLTPNSRLTASGRYLISTDGRDSDSWYIGLGYSLIFGE